MVGYTIYAFMAHTGTTLYLPLSLPPFAVLYSLVLFTFPFSLFLIFFFCSILLLSYHHPYFFQLSLPLSLPHQNPAHTRLSYFLYVPHGPPISFFVIWSTGQYLVMSTNYEAPRQQTRLKTSSGLMFSSAVSNATNVPKLLVELRNLRRSNEMCKGVSSW